MPTNANTFNSRVTSEALEAKFRQVFPAQGGAELVQDLFASGVIQPVVDFSSVAEGSFLAPELQNAWDFSTGSVQITSTTHSTVINNPGFWLVDLTGSFFVSVQSGTRFNNTVRINDGSSTKNVWSYTNAITTSVTDETGAIEDKFVVFLRSGDVLEAAVGNTQLTMDIWYRQIADVNGNLVNPLGFTFS